jgi:nicotinamide riboside kinase
LGVARVAWVAEALRDWCAAHGRTPRRDEQPAILQLQCERIAAAAASHAVVVCDTTALMTAVYSRLVFGDRSLEAAAVAQHRRVTLSLLTALDLAWVADGLQRDGPHVREPVDNTLRELLLGNELPFAVVGGLGEQRLAQALAAVTPLLRTRWAKRPARP